MLLKPAKSSQEATSDRPIQLIYVYNKVLECVVVKHLHVHRSNSYQFIKQPSDLHLVLMTSCFDYVVSPQTTTIQLNSLVLFDLEKAFDKFLHPTLIYKLPNFYLPTVIARCIYKFLSCRLTYVSIHYSLSHLVLIPQGSFFLPLLYLVLVSDNPITRKMSFYFKTG